MSAAAHIALAFALAAAFVYTGARVAIRVALAADFMDRPRGYKGHRAPTPYLGGAAVMFGFFCAALFASGRAAHFAPLLVCAAGLWLVGTIDDRHPVAPRWRVLAELIAAVVISASGLGWEVTGSAVGDLVLTALWVVALVNAFNLMDNLDGAAASVTAASGIGIAAIALANGHTGTAAMAASLTAACVGFLPHNLAKPARIFLGDGGSMPLGFLVATLSIAAVENSGLGAAALVVGGLLAALPILDTMLVIVSRTRRGLSVVTPGRDHLTHRLLTRLGTPLRVATALAAVQLIAALLALLSQRSGVASLALGGVLAVFAAAYSIAVLDSPAWSLAERRADSGDRRSAPNPSASPGRLGRDRRRPIGGAVGAFAYAEQHEATALELQ